VDTHLKGYLWSWFQLRSRISCACPEVRLGEHCLVDGQKHEQADASLVVESDGASVVEDVWQFAKSLGREKRLQRVGEKVRAKENEAKFRASQTRGFTVKGCIVGSAPHRYGTLT